MQPLSADTQDSGFVGLGEISRVPTDTQHTVLGTQPRRETRQTTSDNTGPTSKKSPKGRSDSFHFFPMHLQARCRRTVSRGVFQLKTIVNYS